MYQYECINFNTNAQRVTFSTDFSLFLLSSRSAHMHTHTNNNEGTSRPIMTEIHSHHVCLLKNSACIIGGMGKYKNLHANRFYRHSPCIKTLEAQKTKDKNKRAVLHQNFFFFKGFYFCSFWEMTYFIVLNM